MKPIYRFRILVLFVALSLIGNIHANAASRYWISTINADWNSSANWSTSSTGSGGASVPSSSDDVYFTSSRNGSCNINAEVSVGSLISSGYTGTITQNSNNITISGNFSISAGTFQCGSGNINVAGQFTLSGGSFFGSTGYLDVTSTFNLTGGSFTAPSGFLYIASNWAHTTSGTFIHNSGNVVFDGNGTRSINMISGSESFYHVTINKSSGGSINLTTSGDIMSVNGTLTFTQGSIGSWSSYPVTVRALGNISFASAGSISSTAVTLEAYGTAIQSLDLTGATGVMDGKFALNKSGGSLSMLSNMDMASDLNLISGTLNLNGFNITNSSYDGFCTGTVQVNGTGGISCYGFNLTSGSPSLTLTDVNLTVAQGHFEMSTGTFNGGNSNLDMNYNFQLSGGTFNSTSDTMWIAGYFTHSTAGTFNHNNGIVVFDGSQNTRIQVLNGKVSFYNVQVNKSSNSYYVYQYLNNDSFHVENNLYLTRGNLSSWNSLPVIITIKNNCYAFSTFGTSSYYNELIFNKTGNQYIDLTSATDKLDGKLSINKNSGSLILLSNLTMDGTGSVAGNINLTKGRLKLNGYTFTHSLSTTYVSGRFTIEGNGSYTTYDMTLNGSDTLDFDGTPITLTINHDLTISSGYFISDSTTIDLNRNFVFTGGFFMAPTTTMYAGGGWSNTSSGVFHHGGGHVIFDGSSSWQGYNFHGSETFYNVTMNRSACTFEKLIEGDTLIVENDLNLNSGYFWSRNNEVYGIPNIIKVRGDVNISSGYCQSGSHPPTIVLICGDNQIITATGAEGYFNGEIIINKSSGTVFLGSNLTLDQSNQDLTLGNGTLDFNGKVITLGSGSNHIYKHNGGVIVYNGGSVSGGSVTNTGTDYTPDNNQCLVPVPVKMIRFSVVAGEIVNVIKWATASEINNDYFDVFRVTESGNEKIGSVSGAGNSSSIIEYNWTDASPLPGINCYQIVQVDYDGTSAPSEIKCEQNLATSKVNVFPVPAIDFLYFDLRDIQNISTVELKDISGRSIYRTEITPGKSIQCIDLKKEGVGQGFYYIEIFSPNHQEVQKVYVK